MLGVEAGYAGVRKPDVAACEREILMLLVRRVMQISAKRLLLPWEEKTRIDMRLVMQEPTRDYVS